MLASSGDPIALEAGTMLDEYELLGELARGGMANVWLARQTMKHGLETLVAIKTILPEVSSHPEFQKMFVDEARIACAIDHASVAKILDVGETRSVTYIVMEYVSGEPLARLRNAVRRASVFVPLNVTLRILADLCSGLHAAHELRGADGALLGVVHRDVSPQNVLLADAGAVKLIDFGVAKAKGRLAAETSAGITKGKARYMAPEQALGGDIDRRADVWAVGALLYELVSGATPMDGANDVAVFRALLGTEPVAPLSSDVPAPVRAIAARALERDPTRRFATAAEMRDAIDEAMLDLRLRATSTDIEKLTHAHLSERIEQRKRFIQLALAGAVERKKIKASLESQGSMLQPTPTDRSIDAPARRPRSGSVDPPEETAMATAAASPVGSARRASRTVVVGGIVVVALAGAALVAWGTRRATGDPMAPASAPPAVVGTSTSAAVASAGVPGTTSSPSVASAAPSAQPDPASPKPSAVGMASTGRRGAPPPPPRATARPPTDKWGGIE